MIRDASPAPCSTSALLNGLPLATYSRARCTDEALSVAETAGDPILVALVNYRLGIANVMLGDMKPANEALAKSVRTLDTEEGRRLFAFGGSPFSFACTFRAWALAELGQLAEAERSPNPASTMPAPSNSPTRSWSRHSATVMS